METDIGEFTPFLWGDEDNHNTTISLEESNRTKFLLLKSEDNQKINRYIWRYALNKAVIGARVCILTSERCGKKRYSTLDNYILNLILNEAEITLEVLDRIGVWYISSVHLLKKLLIELLCEQEITAEYLIIDNPIELSEGGKDGVIINILGIVESILRVRAGSIQFVKRIIVISSSKIDFSGSFDLILNLDSIDPITGGTLYEENKRLITKGFRN